MFRVAVAIVFFLLTRAGFGQAPDRTARPPADNTPAESDPFGRLTPFGCVTGFLRAAEGGDYTRAAEYLNTSASPARAQELSQQLQVVLNLGLPGGLFELARTPEGNLRDDLAPTKERAGTVRLVSKKLDIVLDRVQTRNGPPIWLFSSETLRGVPEAFAEFDTPFLVRMLPQPLVETRILGLALWRWLLGLTGITLALLCASLVTRALTPLLRLSLRHITGETDDQRLVPLEGPVRVMLLAVAIKVLSSFAIALLARLILTNISGILAVIGFAWLVMKFSDIVSDLASRRLLRRNKPDKIAMIGLARRLFKIFVALIAAIALLQRSGVNVTAMLAGLGVGGIALALAAQKTLENVFGGISIIMRETVRVGDSCRLADQIGTIEDIGLGSIRLRTLDRSVVSIPNAQLAQQNMENMSLRDKFWIHQTLRLSGDTSADQMRSILAGIEDTLSGHPAIESRTIRIRFIGFGHGSFTIEVFAYMVKPSYESFLQAQQESFLRIMDVISASGAVLASPAPVIEAGPFRQSLDRGGRPLPKGPAAASR